MGLGDKRYGRNATTKAANRKVIVGVCAMEKKSQSKPMQAILRQMLQYYGDYLATIIFEEEVILNEDVSNWPLCDCLISFHAHGFPVHKAIAYSKLHPEIYVINDLVRQYDLLDRTQVYDILERSGIEHPRYAVLRRYPENPEKNTPLVEGHDQIEINGETFNKPFVEKPCSAEDHNIYVYYPSSSGGGSQRLFRKVANRSSEYSSTSRIRQEGSFLYEEFMPTDGTDVKVYAVGPDYAHAEARKSPALDGKVERDSEGKEVRYPVILTNKEKMIARKVVLAFKQTVCGFDLLRTHGHSYVCDVNGFSFVKTSHKYYEDTAKILGNMILRNVARRLGIPWKRPYQPDDPPMAPTTVGKMMELRCVLGVIRHGDRTPKQKMKMEVSDRRFFELFKKYKGEKTGELKLKKPKQLQEVLDLARQLLKEMQDEIKVKIKFSAKDGDENGKRAARAANDDISQANARSSDDTPSERTRKDSETSEDTLRKWDQVRGVLEMYGHFAGINRKVQLKYLPKGLARRSSDSESSETPRSPSLLLILKWGGELTTAGRLQAESLGRLFRTLYPGIEGGGHDTQGMGFLRLHSTYRHDLKIYASDEGRVQMTAAAFTKGLLALEGELAPIVSQMVKSANTNGLLDDDFDARKYQSEVKKFLHNYLQVNREWTQEDLDQLNPLGSRSIRLAVQTIRNPREYCETVAARLNTLCEILSTRKKKYEGQTLYLNETWELAERRWSKLYRDFKHVKRGGEVVFDISKIPDIYDNIRYDIQHNPVFLQIEDAYVLYATVKHMADLVVPQEYGIKRAQKLSIAQGICIPLMKKLRVDLQRCIHGTMEDENLTRLDPRASQGIATPLRHVRTRLYFTSESHIHSLMNLIRFGGLFDSTTEQEDKQWQRALSFVSAVSEFNYMTQVVLLMYEDTAKALTSPDRFHVELLFSPGLFPLFITPKNSFVGKYRSRSLRAKRNNDPHHRRGSNKSNSSDLVGDEKTIDDDDSDGMEGLPDLDESFEDGNHAYNVVSLSDFIQQPICREELAKHSPPTTPVLSGPIVKCLSDAAVPSSSSPALDASNDDGGTADDDEDDVNNKSKEKNWKSDGEQQQQMGSSSNQHHKRSRRVHHHHHHHHHQQHRQHHHDPQQDHRQEQDEQGSQSQTHRMRHISQPSPPSGGSKERSQSARQSPAPRNTYNTGRHHTINLLQGEHNKLISTAVISGILGKEQKAEVQEVLSPSLVRGSSAPDLKLYDIDENSPGRLPPLFSLETLHNQLSHKVIDEFLERITTIRTPIPSPPLLKMSRENSSLCGEMSSSATSDTAGKLLSGSEPAETMKRLTKRLTSLQPLPKEES